METPIRVEQGILYVEAQGQIDDAYLLNLVEMLLSHPDYSPEAPVAWDFRRAEVGALSSMLQVMQRAPRYFNEHSGRTALLVNTDLGYGLSRQATAINHERDTRIFREPEPGEVEAFLKPRSEPESVS